jgi:amino acid adenylation domain-containing protein
MLEDAQAPLVLAQSHLASWLPEQPGEVLLLEPGDAPREGEFGEDPPDQGTPDNLAYVIFTSGSTGRPKGAMNTHRAICNRLWWMQEEYGLLPSDRVLQKTTFSFDVSVWEFFWPLLTGATLEIARPEGHKDTSYLVQLIREQRITTLHFVPSMLSLFLEEPEVDSCRSLKRVICSGEALPHELQERFFSRLSGVELHNHYGPTEAAVDVTYWACRPGDERKVVPIGRPVANTQMHVLDGRLNLMPVGAPGELYIGGIQVGRGYVRRPELTAERFVPDPFTQEAGARLYKTGDLARHLPDGAIEYLGRLDHQVKIRGQRIELGEIEEALRQDPEVESAVVLAQDVSGGDRRLVAYLSHGAQGQPNVTALRNHLKASLPVHMVPSSFVFLDRLPLTPSGKVDRKALARLDGGQVAATKEFVAPRTKAELFIALLWREMLGLEKVGVRDNFFDLGGHSLLAMRVLAAIEKETGQHLHPRAIIFQTLEQIAASCEAAPGVAPPPAAAESSGIAGRLMGALRRLVPSGSPDDKA